MEAYMYILKCVDDSYYTGSTNDLEARMEEHHAGRGANFTSERLPVMLVYCELFERIDEAWFREKQIQKWSRKKKEALIAGDKNQLRELAKNYTRFPRES
jgi:putative endonuclease